MSRKPCESAGRPLVATRRLTDEQLEMREILVKHTFWSYLTSSCDFNARELLTKHYKAGAQRSICPAVDSGSSESTHEE